MPEQQIDYTRFVDATLTIERNAVTSVDTALSHGER